MSDERLATGELYAVRDLPDADELNRALCMAFAESAEDPQVRRSHFFHGRFENLYVPLEMIPQLAPVLAFAEASARGLLMPPGGRLRVGFWFNRMQPGDVTTLHTHEEDDELLSAVYYLRAPPGSGDLIFETAGGSQAIEPREGRLVLFPPSIPHRVAENRSGEMRISIGMNIGPAVG